MLRTLSSSFPEPGLKRVKNTPMLGQNMIQAWSLSITRQWPGPSCFITELIGRRWKKVTTNVSNFIMGNPIIDHYGDLVVTNHRTGEKCTLTFKPRGWRGGNAFEISGKVVDASGRDAWDIAGRELGSWVIYSYAELQDGTLSYWLASLARPPCHLK